MKLTMLSKLTMAFIIINLGIIETEQNSNFYNNCVQAALQGLTNLGLPLSLNREVEQHLMHDPPQSKLPIEMEKESGNGTDEELVELAKMVLDTNAKDAVFNDGLEYLSIPKHELKERMRYLLFTKASKNEYQVMPENGSVVGTNWDRKKQTKILIHGMTSTHWFSAVKNIWLQHIFDLKDAYLDPDNSIEGDCNVVVVDWTSLSTVPLMRYPDAAIATHLAAEDVVSFLLNLKSNGNLRSMKDVHLLGHSLGAHVAGIAGSTLRDMDSSYTIQRITGLDPAGPCFDTTDGIMDDTRNILDRSDAHFVDIIHTNMGNLIKTVAGRYGSVMQTGHVDFYPNGGEVQQGCNFLQNRLGFCSHQKSVTFFALSISKRFMACPCSSWDFYGSEECACTMKTGGQYFGEHVDPFARGKFFLPL